MSIKILKYLSIVFVFHTIYVGKVVAEQIKVATDISPIYALVLSVMKGVNEPELIIQHGKSPHHHSLKPSEAKTFNIKDLIDLNENFQYVWYVAKSLRPDLNAYSVHKHNVSENSSGEHNF